MITHRKKYIKNQLLPCLGFSAAAGFLSAIIITTFKYIAEQIFALSKSVYSFVSANPVWLPVLLIGVGVIGLLAALLVSRSDVCKGGGIPTSVSAIRGLTGFKWISSIVLLPISALLSFFVGIPLGTEGPCVQIGTAIGDGVVTVFGGKKHNAWCRYVMSGGASAGFSLATGAPITAILFSMEELNKRFSPLLLSVAAVSVATSQIAMQLFSLLGISSINLFNIGTLPFLPLNLIYAPIILGVITGLCAIVFTLAYHKIDDLMRRTLGKFSSIIKFPIIFICTALIGFFFTKVLWSGHSLIENLFQTETLWSLLVIALLIRAILMMVANTSGVTGGIFLPTLAFGALIGALVSDALISVGLLSIENRAIMIVLGMASFLGSTSRIPITACVFATEALGGVNNVMYIVITVIIATLTIEASGLEDFTDTVVETRLKSIHAGKKPITVESTLTIIKDSFAIGKESTDILWPASCVVVSTQKAEKNKDLIGFGEGDVICVRFKTYNPSATAKELEHLVGKQTK